MENRDQDTIFVPPDDFFDNLVNKMKKLQTQIDELKKLYYSNSKTSRDIFLFGCELAGSQYQDLQNPELICESYNVFGFALTNDKTTENAGANRDKHY